MKGQGVEVGLLKIFQPLRGITLEVSNAADGEAVRLAVVVHVAVPTVEV